MSTILSKSDLFHHVSETISLTCLFSPSAFAQMMPQDEIDQAVVMMRQSSTPEEIIKQFPKGIKQANVFQQQMKNLQAQGLSEDEAAMGAAGVSDNFKALEFVKFANTLGDPINGQTLSYRAETRPKSTGEDPQTFVINLNCC
ncbi:hypothetical protein AB3Y40_09845 [Yoonia sp. R2331]|uniref:hypothetical protein n=1 Tax=Yoonia sp. R2331 TaxID=3237238 RepID=UPI0034E51F5B